jgi:hypothetical protein
MMAPFSDAKTRWDRLPDGLEIRITEALRDLSQVDNSREFNQVLWELMDEEFNEPEDNDVIHLRNVGLNVGMGAPAGGGEGPESFGRRVLMIWTCVRSQMRLQEVTDMFIDKMPAAMRGALRGEMQALPCEPHGAETGYKPDHYNIATCAKKGEGRHGHHAQGPQGRTRGSGHSVSSPAAASTNTSSREQSPGSARPVRGASQCQPRQQRLCDAEESSGGGGQAERDCR